MTSASCMSMCVDNLPGPGADMAGGGGSCDSHVVPPPPPVPPSPLMPSAVQGWALLQGGELTEGGTCPGPLPRQWRTPPSVLRRIYLYRSLCFRCLDVTIHSFAWGDFLTSLSLLLVVQNLPVRKLNGSQGGQRFYFTIPLQN